MNVPAAPTGAPRLITVVIPARDEEDLIGEQLDALAAQVYEGRWEVVVVDDGSRDGTRRVASGRSGSLPDLRIVDGGGRGLSAARNLGVREAGGDLVAFCDADDVVVSGWLAALAAAAPGSHIVGGPLEHLRLNQSELLRGWVPQEVPDALHRHSHFLEFAPGGNCAIWTAVAERIGWDESLRFGGTDLDFCWRAALDGYEFELAPGALIHRRFPDRPLELLLTFFRYGASEPLLYRRFRSQGMRRTSREEVTTAWRRLLGQVPELRSSPQIRGDWLRKLGLRLGRIAGSLRHRVVYL